MDEKQFGFLSQELTEFESFLKEYISQKCSQSFAEGLKELKNSIQYTLFSPCKRFRPALSFGAAQAVGLDYKKVLPLAGAIEFIHTSSLIHDDLPSMDNDVQRRGRASNHVVFNEDMALLAGDALLMEAFCLLCHFQQNNSVIQCVAESASFNGMMGGQSLDLRPEQSLSLDSIVQLYNMKTGALIRAAVEGVFCLKKLSSSEMNNLRDFAYYLGLAFQLADDLEDSKNCEKGSLLQLMNLSQAKSRLEEWTQKSLSALKDMPAAALKRLVHINQDRIC